jgi:hypothetical protein
MDEPGFDLVAAELRADTTDLKAFVEALAVKLAGSFPGWVRVERRGGLFSGAKPVRRIELTLGDDRYELDHDGGRVTCVRRAVVRGIAIRSDELGLDDWIDHLARALVREADSTAQGRAALAQLLEQ